METRILTAVDIVGFFADEATSSSPVWMVETSYPADGGAKRLQDVELQVLDLRREIIGAYYVGEVPVIGVKPSRTGGVLTLNCPSRLLLPVQVCRRALAGLGFRCARQARGMDTVAARGHASWLHVVQSAWFSAGRRAAREERRSNPSALDDCLRNSMASSDRFELVWHSFDLSERVLDKAELGYVLDVFNDLGVRWSHGPTS